MGTQSITVYTDGACSGNPGPGGYGVWMCLDGTSYSKEFSQGYRKTTNNRMELLAVIVALENIKKNGQRVSVYTDSKYVHDAIEKGWLKNWLKKNFAGKKNADLWKRFVLLYEKHEVKIHWIKGHAGHIGNEKADRLAVNAIAGKNLLPDIGYEATT